MAKNEPTTKPSAAEPLTDHERQFIIDSLTNLPLSGKAAALRQAVETIDSIVAKLKAQMDE